MAQPRQSAMDLSKVDALSSPSILKQSKPVLTVTIHPGHDPALEPVALLTRDTHGLRNMLAECKRLKELTDANYEPEVTPPFTWVIPYISRSVPKILSPIPPDLRHIHRPVHTLLSHATAGQPSDEPLDISLIREDWIKHKVYDEVFGPSQKMPLKIRIGTFNVNGKLPSQDLSPWLRGDSIPSHSLPPLKEVSPLSLGEHGAKSYFEAQGEHAESASVASTVISTSGTTEADTSTASHEQTSASASQTTLADTRIKRGDNNDPDIFVLGFQELDLSTEALLYSTKTTREDAWCAAVLAGLGERAGAYRKLISKQLVGMLIIIIVKKELVAYFGDVQATSVGAGILGLMGNKGAAAIRLVFSPPGSSSESSPSPQSRSVYGSPHSITRPVILTFVNSHLAAFDEMYDRRNADFNDLSRRISFDSGIPIQDPAAAPEGYPPRTVPLSVYQSDVLFWVGDLNYRINLPDADVRTLLEQPERGRLALLQQYDQLKLAIRTKKAFSEFVEHEITHPPSYRFSVDLMTDNLGYDTKRKPAWTDRVLYMNSPVTQVKQLSYSSHPEITMSDHKPVSADFVVHMPVVYSDTLDSFVRSLWRHLMDIENSEELPKIKLTPSAVDFGKVFYKRTMSQILELSNVGKVPCAFRFVPITEGAPIYPDWMKIEPMSGLIRPGENLKVTLIAEIDNPIAQKLNAGSSRLDDTLILHTSLGKDHFIAISGQYQRTCFATSLERLVRFSGPARSIEGNSKNLEDATLNAPQEAMRLINWLMGNATEVKNLFLLPGDPRLVADIRECLDTGADFNLSPEIDFERIALAVATCLTEFLSSLPESLIPDTLQPRCAQATSRDAAFELLDNLPSASVNVWISVTAFLHFVSQQDSEDRKNRAGELADIFSPILLRDDLDVLAPISPISKRRFLLFFIAPS